MSSIRAELGLPPGPVDLNKIDTRGTPMDPGGTAAATAAREDIGRELADLQERLVAEAEVHGTRRRVLLVLQGMDAAGKDGIIQRSLGGMNPKWLDITGFGPPTEEELSHDFLWRIRRALPRHGHVGVFDRSHYEDIVAVRVRELVPETEWRPRYEEINAFERELADDGCAIVKVFLHISPEYQLERQLRRLDRVDKRWKFAESDLDDRECWPEFQAAYEEALERCNTPAGPWYIVPADRKWYRMWAVSQLVLETMRDLDPQWPERPDLDLGALRARLHAV